MAETEVKRRSKHRERRLAARGITEGEEATATAILEGSKWQKAVIKGAGYTKVGRVVGVELTPQLAGRRVGRQRVMVAVASSMLTRVLRPCCAPRHNVAVPSRSNSRTLTRWFTGFAR